MLLAMLGTLGRSVEGNIRSERDAKTRKDLELLKLDREQGWRTEDREARSKESALNRQTQLDVARTYADARSRNGSTPPVWSVDADMVGDPDLAADQAELDDLAKNNNWLTGADNSELIKQKQKLLQSKGRKLWLERQRSKAGQPADAQGGASWTQQEGESWSRGMQQTFGGKGAGGAQQPTGYMEPSQSRVQGGSAMAPEDATTMLQLTSGRLSSAYQRWMVDKDPAAWMELNQFFGGKLQAPPEALPMTSPGGTLDRVNGLGTFQQQQ